VLVILGLGVLALGVGLVLLLGFPLRLATLIPASSMLLCMCESASHAWVCVLGSVLECVGCVGVCAVSCLLVWVGSSFQPSGGFLAFVSGFASLFGLCATATSTLLTGMSVIGTRSLRYVHMVGHKLVGCFSGWVGVGMVCLWGLYVVLCGSGMEEMSA